MIFLIRHGQTAGNADRVVQTPDTPLSDHGRWEAARLGARLRPTGLTRIMCSDYPRARQTAAALAPDESVPIDQTPLLRERDLAGLAGRRYDEVEGYFYGPDHDGPDCEPWLAFRARVARAWAEVGTMVADTEAPVAVVTHGLVCRALAQFHLEHPSDTAPLDWFPNASVTHIEARAPWMVRLAGCVKHLERSSL